MNLEIAFEAFNISSLLDKVTILSTILSLLYSKVFNFSLKISIKMPTSSFISFSFFPLIESIKI